MTEFIDKKNMDEAEDAPLKKIGSNIDGRNGGSGTDESQCVEYDGAEDVGCRPKTVTR